MTVREIMAMEASQRSIGIHDPGQNPLRRIVEELGRMFRVLYLLKLQVHTLTGHRYTPQLGTQHPQCRTRSEDRWNAAIEYAYAQCRARLALAGTVRIFPSTRQVPYIERLPEIYRV